MKEMPESFDEYLSEQTAQCQMPDGSSYKSVSRDAVLHLTREFGASPLRVEVAALRRGCIPERYVRNFKAFTLEEQIRLLESRVLLVGLGGLGGGVLELLLRTGVGRITAADHDRFEESNLNRQLLSTTGRLDVSKAEAAMERALQVNPSAEFMALDEYLEYPRMLELAREADVVVDALGGLDSRPSLWKAAEQAGRPLISAAVAGESGCVGAFFPGGPGPSMLFGSANGEGGRKGAVRAAENVLGTQAGCVHFAASLQASETVRLLRSPVEEPEDKVLFFDLRDLSF